jgi:hypothetical protein
MKYLNLTIAAFVVMVLATSCDKDENNTTPTSVVYHQATNNAMDFKTGEDDDDLPSPMRIIRDTINNPSSATTIIELVDVNTNVLVATTSADISGQFSFYNVPTGRYMMNVKINGIIDEVIYITL